MINLLPPFKKGSYELCQISISKTIKICPNQYADLKFMQNAEFFPFLANAQRGSRAMPW